MGFRQTKELDELLNNEAPGCRIESTVYKSQFAFSGEEDAEPGSLEQLMYDGMH